MLILGVDPGTVRTGYGLLEKKSDRVVYVDDGEIVPPKEFSLAERLKIIYRELSGLVRQHQPDILAVEDIFYAKNFQSAIRLGYARGIVLLVGAEAGVQICEYSPLEVKQAVVGYGRATKTQVQGMIQRLLKLPYAPMLNASDALAVGICHAHRERAENVLSR